MGVTRRIVLPAIRVLLLGAIAVALLKLAFADDGEAEAGDPLTPSAEIADPEVTVATGTIANDVEVTSTITANPPVTAKATDEGTVNVLLADPGDVLAAGDPLLEVVFEEPGEAQTETDDDGNVTEVPGEPVRRYRTIEAPVAGTLGEFSVLRGQAVAIGDAVATITTGGFTVSGTLTPEQQYRLVDAPAAAQVAPQGGQAPFDCAGLSVGHSSEPAAPAEPAGEGGGGDPMTSDPATGTTGGSSTVVTCAVPAGTTVFDGAAATMTISAGRAEAVLVAPVTAVEGSFETGNVWVKVADAEPEKRAVTLGLTDGELVEIRSGLTEGETILEFVPGREDEPVVDDDMLTGEAG